MKMNYKKMVAITLFVGICSATLVGCKNKGETVDSSQDVTGDVAESVKEIEDVDSSQSTTPEETVIEEKKYLSVQTSIAYSSGDTKNWSYGNQRKEFPDNESCYVRVESKAITSNFFGKGKGDEIVVTYRFTGTTNCKVEVSDGKAKMTDIPDPDITEFTHTISAAKEKKATEDVLIFRYYPSNADSVVLEVIYDDQVAEKYDEYNTIYFIKDKEEQTETQTELSPEIQTEGSSEAVIQ